MEKLDVEFELFRKRVYNLEIRSFYLLLLNRGCDIKTLKALFSDVDEKLALKMDGMFYRCSIGSSSRSVRESNPTRKDKCEDGLF